jgi:Fur family transcriptional regulator, ferric uptake regulator
MHTHHDNVRDILHQKGLKSTPLREKLIHVLKEGHAPMSVDEIGKKLKSFEFDQASLFRTLKKLAEAGVLSQVNLGEGFVRYEYACLTHDHHHHVMCTECKKITVLPFCIPPEIEVWLKKKGYTNIGHRLDFHAVCAECK